MTLPPLTVNLLCAEARTFAEQESLHPEPLLYGVTDGKAVGTYLEHKFRLYLQQRYTFTGGNSASGIDFPSLNIDMKVTSIRQPQSSSPFQSARQKIYGLGYGLMVFVYDKLDDPAKRVATLRVCNAVYVELQRTADFQMTKGLRQIVESEGNLDDLMAFLADKNLPVDEIERRNLAQKILEHTPEQGYLTISNALQWRLQYSRVIEQAGQTPGIRSIHREQ